MFIYFFVGTQEQDHNSRLKSIKTVKELFHEDVENLMEGKYPNLISNKFDASIEAVESVYEIEIIAEDILKNSFSENLQQMEASIEKFFGKDIDKSFLEVEAYMIDAESEIMNYTEVEQFMKGEKFHNVSGTAWLSGSDSENGYYVQVFSGLLQVWYSKNGVNTIYPSVEGEIKAVYPYISGVRQEEVMIQLKDGEIALSEMEQMVLDYMNSEDFPLIKGDGINYGIGEARVLKAGEFEGLCFLTRRVYKGVPFEYGSSTSVGAYTDNYRHDNGEITYVDSSSPDTMLGFFRASGTVVEKQEITEMITAGEALSLLSEQIGDNSVYEVHGIELVYRNCEIPENKMLEISDILEPKWKIITINQNDDKYTMFYVDVVTGEITNRFEYYYD